MAENTGLSLVIITCCYNYFEFPNARGEILPIIYEALQEVNIDTLDLYDLRLLGEISRILNRLEYRTDIEEQYIGRIFPGPPQLVRS